MVNYLKKKKTENARQRLKNVLCFLIKMLMKMIVASFVLFLRACFSPEANSQPWKESLTCLKLFLLHCNPYECTYYNEY